MKKLQRALIVLQDRVKEYEQTRDVRDLWTLKQTAELIVEEAERLLHDHRRANDKRIGE